MIFGSSAASHGDRHHGPDRGSGSPDALLRDAKVEVAHSIPGRIRLRVEGLKHAGLPEVSLRQKLEAIAHVHSVVIHPRSNSVILRYDPAAETAFFASLRLLAPNLREARQASRYDSADSAYGPRFGPADTFAPWSTGHLEEAVTKLFQNTNQRVQSATGGIDLKLLVPAVLLLLSIIGLVVGATKQRRLSIPSWYELLWFAFNTFVILNLTLAQREHFESGQADLAAARETDSQSKED